MMKKVSVIVALSLFVVSLFMAGSRVFAKDLDVEINKVSIGVKGYEFGPAVPRVIVELDSEVSSVSKDNVKVTTAGVDRKIKSVYLSNKNGKKIKSGSSKYVTIQMPVSFDAEKNAGEASPFTYNMDIFQNQWSSDYKVTIKGLEVGSDDQTASLSTEADAINNRIAPEAAVFKNRGSFSGTYTNPMTDSQDELTLNYAAYEPKDLAKGKKNPLIIWLHGQGEGGEDPDISLLGNEVVALAREDIQKHFTAGKQTGAYVLVVQAPTYWMDEGDGTNGAGAGVSRYTEILMDAIKDYVANNADVDTNRIYLAGCSNGGYMTLNLAIHNPDYFAGLAPLATAYSYYEYEREADNSYTRVPSEESLSGTEMVPTEDIYFDDEKVSALKDIPIWFVHSANDTTVDPTAYSLPIYKALVDSGAENKWFSYYETVEGSDMKDTEYLGHWSWVYFFNDQVAGVQDAEAVKKADELTGFKANNKNKGGSATAESGGKEYDNIFDWLNAQSK
ncbi:prolyl oligopeptidase family serine peptidase [Streptococcus huangxiaojuni]|uniref:prolyl oligopeptidase family serine peptidase n=1 Tax=Streptococcus huangxiaojuni TaxID=3237239 RepID=UPI003F5EB4F2